LKFSSLLSTCPAHVLQHANNDFHLGRHLHNHLTWCNSLRILSSRCMPFQPWIRGGCYCTKSTTWSIILVYSRAGLCFFIPVRLSTVENMRVSKQVPWELSFIWKQQNPTVVAKNQTILSGPPHRILDSEAAN
jgi:hypothetical protein